MKITIETIPHLEQRYNTCGDWSFDKNDNLTIKVSEMPVAGDNGSMLIAIHELVEALLCRMQGITTADVDAYDLAYDATDGVEAGDQPDAPYHAQHCVATGIERMLAPMFDMRWLDYEAELDDMTEEYANKDDHE
jgi:hypothetical protein